MANNLQPFPFFEYDSDKANVAVRWEKWVKRLDNYFIAMDITNGERQRALLLHYAGEQVHDIYEAEKQTYTDGTSNTYEDAKTVLVKYFRQKKNTNKEIDTFRSCKQKQGQTLHEYVTELRTLSKTCEFTSTDKEILTQVIQHCDSYQLRHLAFREPDKTLTEIINIWRTLEMADTQAFAMEHETVHAVKPKHKNTSNRKLPHARNTNNTSGPLRSTQHNPKATQQPGSLNGPHSPSAVSPRGVRRSGEIEGVRQATGNVPISQQASRKDSLPWRERGVVLELSAPLRSLEKRRHLLAEEEQFHFKVEKRRKPSVAFLQMEDSGDSLDRLRKRKKANYGYGTRSKKKAPRKQRREQREREQREQDREEINSEDEGEETSVMSGGYTTEDEVEMRSSSESGSETSEYSDWTADVGINLEPPKRSQRQVTRRRFNSGGSEEEEESTTSPRKTNRKESKPRKKKPPATVIEDQVLIKELPEEMKPPRWVTASTPRPCPYIPQMGDEVVYLRQGHERYYVVVKMMKLYKIDLKKQPRYKRKLRDKELVKVVDIKYQIGPPTLCGLKLAFIDPETRKQTGSHFSIKYHDMSDEIDFLVLRQHYDNSIAHNWKAGDQFRAMIDNAWWLGTIINQEPFQEEYPDSFFQCYNIA